MPRTKTIAPIPTHHKGQRSQEPLYLNRILPQWRNPEWLEGEIWRAVVAQQPVAVDCRDTLISTVVNLDWTIEAKDPNTRDELDEEIKYYIRFLTDNEEFDYVEHVEWIGKDYLDLPFGGATEVGRENNDPNGRVVWLALLDGATLFPTLNYDYPVGQQVAGINPVYFPYYGINRIYMSPKTSFLRKGWGCAPPEKIYLAIQLLNRGDVYYANLLLDTPQVGILDLIDMSKDSAEAWIDSWATLLKGVDPFKIPVLYEHEKKAEFISFTRPPTELMFDKATAKYETLTTAAYGMSPSDIGISATSSGGDTLAGSIRQERKTRQTGRALFKKKLNLYFNRLLPDYLNFKFIDMDDELNVAIGRARLATATAMQIFLQNKVIVPNEARQQVISDGLFTIPMKESIEGGDKPLETAPSGGSDQANSDQLGRSVAPSQGGYGQKSMTKDELTANLLDISDDINDNSLVEN